MRIFDKSLFYPLGEFSNLLSRRFRRSRRGRRRNCGAKFELINRTPSEDGIRTLLYANRVAFSASHSGRHKLPRNASRCAPQVILEMEIVPTPSSAAHAGSERATARHKLNIVKCQCVHGRGIPSGCASGRGNASDECSALSVFRALRAAPSAESNERSNGRLKNGSHRP